MRVIHIQGFEDGGQKHRVFLDEGDGFERMGDGIKVTPSSLGLSEVATTGLYDDLPGLTGALSAKAAVTVTDDHETRISDLEAAQHAQVGTWANRTGSVEGDLYVCTDSLLQYVHDGSSLQAVYQGRIVTPPASGDWTWINQGTATLDGSRGGLFLNVPSAGGTSVKLLVKALPASSNYRVSIGVRSTVYQNDAHSCGIFATAAASGGVMTSMAFVNAAVEFSKWNSPTSFNSNYTSFGTSAVGGWEWLALYDDGTNRNYQVSRDGYNWLTLHSVTRTDHVTPAYWGVGFNARKAVQANWFCYKEETGL